jgi:hypothetical protein
MTDYSFFAMLFAIATSLSPPTSHEVSLVNVRHPEQRIVFSLGDGGRWTMTLNQRDVGRFERVGDAVFHHTDLRSPDRHLLSELLDPSTLGRGTERIPLRGTFAPAVLTVRRAGGEITIEDPSREVLMSPLALRAL